MTKINLGRGIVAITQPLQKTLSDLEKILSQNEKILSWAKAYGYI
jgi:hypothetical protein